MNLERYGFHKKRTYKNYEFYSEGPNGRIRKIVCFTPLFVGELACYNLSFGDGNPQNSKIDYHVKSNNGDVEKILATVGAIVIHFIDMHPDAIIYAWGSNKARTRLYQIGINRMWKEISALFHVYGFVNGNPEPFKKNVCYDAFLVHGKENVYLQEETESYMRAKKTGQQKKSQLTNRFAITFIETDSDPFIRKQLKQGKKLLEEAIFPEEILERFAALR